MSNQDQLAAEKSSGSINYERLLIQLTVAKLRLLDDLEVQLRTLGKNYLDAGEPIPEWVWTDLEAVILAQGGLA